MHPTAASYERPTIARMPQSSGTINVIAIVRLVLASAVLVEVYLYGDSLSWYLHRSHLLIGFYVLYSALLCLPFPSRIMQHVREQAHWLDIGWFTLFLFFVDATGGIFQLGFFFATVTAAFTREGGTSLRVAVVSFLIIITNLLFKAYWVGSQAWAAVDPNLFVRAVFLLLLGALMFCWCNIEVKSKRRLWLLKEVATLSNPRFGVDRTLGFVLERLREFYNADACLLLMTEHSSSGCGLRRAMRGEPQKAVSTEEIGADLTQQLLALPATQVALYREGRGLFGLQESCQVFDGTQRERGAQLSQTCENLAALLDTRSFITAPVIYHKQAIGRLYLTSQQRQAFDASDTEFLSQLIQHVLPVVENIRLVDRLASDAADQERQRIARDIHDSVIQPYIGIQMGLGAIRQKLETGRPDVARDLEHLIKLTEGEITGLRSYVGGLSNSKGAQVNLLTAVKRFAKKFTDATGIAVEIKAETDIRINDRLAAEAFQLVAEGLSNIRRHTTATKASISMACHQDRFHLYVENEANGENFTENFVPKSITARAASLGGRVHVNRIPDGGTSLNIVIPL